LRQLAVLAVLFYQRWISPRKGFSCSYRIHTGRSSCSALGLRAIRRYGILQGVLLLRRRTDLCGVAHRRFTTSQTPMWRLKERGSCDFPCDVPCDGNGCDMPKVNLKGCTDHVSCCDCCDWPSRKEKKGKDKEREDQVYLPPKAGGS
jgi:uncharacterized protein